MVVEVLDESQPWPIQFPEIPEEPPRKRLIEATLNGEVVACWRWSGDEWRSPGSFDRGWVSIVQSCMRNGWSLRSVPVVDPLDAGTAEMVRKQLATHVTVPAFVSESCQFEKLGEPGKDEWRAIFKAGLDAFHAAGGRA